MPNQDDVALWRGITGLPVTAVRREPSNPDDNPWEGVMVDGQPVTPGDKIVLSLDFEEQP